MVLAVTYDRPEPRFTDPRFEPIKAAPPPGCEPFDCDGLFGLRCTRTADTLLDAVAEVCKEVLDEHGITMTDLGIEKLWEWSTDGRDGFGATIVGQLLLMASYRARLLGYGTEDLVRFLRTSNATA
ncbi:hypothetical protein GCM10010174_76750 [Kutzneria viridogrisea]